MGVAFNFEFIAEKLFEQRIQQRGFGVLVLIAPQVFTE